MEKLADKKVIKMPQQYTSPENRQVLVPKIKVFFNAIVTSAHTINMDHLNLVGTKSDLSPKQVVVAVGENAVVKVGDFVFINVDTFPRTKKPGPHDVGSVEQIIPPFGKVGSTQYLFMNDRNIKYQILKDD